MQPDVTAIERVSASHCRRGAGGRPARGRPPAPVPTTPHRRPKPSRPREAARGRARRSRPPAGASAESERDELSRRATDPTASPLELRAHQRRHDQLPGPRGRHADRRERLHAEVPARRSLQGLGRRQHPADDGALPGLRPGSGGARGLDRSSTWSSCRSRGGGSASGSSAPSRRPRATCRRTRRSAPRSASWPGSRRSSTWASSTRTSSGTTSRSPRSSRSLAYQLGSGWSLSLGDLQWPYDWDRGEFLSMPIGVQLGKVLPVAKQPMRFAVNPQYDIKDLPGGQPLQDRSSRSRCIRRREEATSDRSGVNGEEPMRER